MRFISGLKNLSKKTILLIIVILFIISWLLFILSHVIFLNNTFSLILGYFLGFLTGFTFILLVLSIFISIDKMGKILLIVVAVLTIPIVWMFTGFIFRFFIFCFFANLVLTAFFAFKVCMDSSTGIDDYLYKKKSSRKITRILEFVIFLFLSLWLGLIIIRFFINSGIPEVQNVFITLLWIDAILLAFVLIRLLFSKKLAAYISIFYLLTLGYMLYLIVDLWSEFLFLDPSGYDILSFFIDLLLFIYIIGSIFDRVEYIKKKIKILRADTIALFVILMKLVVQIIRIQQDLGYVPTVYVIASLIIQVRILLFFFTIFTLLIGIYTIFAHKVGKRK